MNAHAVLIDVRQRLEIFHSLHLVLHLLLSELTECSLLEVLSAMLASAVVEDEEQIAFLCHVCLP